MATGYTYPIINGDEEISFNKFAWEISRAFMHHLRDYSAEDGIVMPELSNYHKDELDKAMTNLAKATARTAADWVSAAQERNDKVELAHLQSAERCAEELRRFNNMLARVEAWTPPSADHEGMKNYMKEQLHESIKWVGEPLELTVIDGPTLKASKFEGIQQDIVYHSEKLAKDVENYQKGTAWIEALVESIGAPEKDND